ncbi:MAG TPA: hypothetical protein VNZ52_03790 [Candidatus Thermoplasmatota archaeon]|nr:hypothetical protein [Candidatus Thermoplasmatota archaeon]
MVKRVTAWKMGVGAFLGLLLFGVIGGLLFLQMLVAQTSLLHQEPDDLTNPRLLIDAGGGHEWFNDTLPSTRYTALTALMYAQEKDGLKVSARSAAEGDIVEAINGRGDRGTEGPRWQFWVHRDGNWTFGGRTGAQLASLHPGDVLVWSYATAPADPAAGPAGYGWVANRTLVTASRS